MENTMEIVKWDRYFALYDQGQLVCVTVYKKGAQEVRRRIEELKSMVEAANGSYTGDPSQNAPSAQPATSKETTKD